jgi:hypothetical protein
VLTLNGSQVVHVLIAVSALICWLLPSNAHCVPTDCVLACRAGDGSSRWARFSAPNTTEIGAYRFTPNQTTALYPQLAKLKPLVTNPSVFNKAIKNAILQKHIIPSAVYNADLAYVVAQGSKDSTVRTQYNTDSVTFWTDGPSECLPLSRTLICLYVTALPTSPRG